MNLQVQLVPPQSRGILPRQSVDFEAGQSSSLHRSGSTRSQESSTTYGSTSSFSSATSTATSAASSARRAIVPLYNLQAHNVLPNVIVDAGTDAKIAKFQKRGIELIDLALFEPVEVWPDPNAVVMPIAAQALAVPVVAPGASTSTLGRLSVDEMGFTQVSTRVGSAPSRSIPTFLATHTITGSTNDGPFAPDDLAPNPDSASIASLSSTSHADHQIGIDSTALHQPETPPDTAGIPPGSSRRNFFGKIFKKSPKDAPQSPMSPYLASPPPTSAPARPSLSRRLPTPSVQSSVPRPHPTRFQTRQSPETSNESCDQVGTPTPMQDMTTPTLQQQPHLNSKDLPGTGGVKRTNGLRSSWLLGSSSSSQRPPTASSPLATAFSTLGMKRRSVIGSGPAPDSIAAVNLNLSQTNVDTPQGTQSANAGLTHVLTNVQSNQIQSQPQLCPAVLGIQPTLVVVPTSFVHNKRRESKSPGPTESRERGNDNNGSPKSNRQGKGSRRPYMYAWLARKWMKRRPSLPPSPSTPASRGPKVGLGGLHLGTGLGLDASWMHTTRDHELSVEDTVEVRFEWRRTPIVVGSKKKLNAGGEGGESSAEWEEHGHHGRGGKRNRRSRDGSRRREGDEKAVRKDGSFDAQDEVARRTSSSSISSARAAVKRWSLASYQTHSTASEEASGDTGADDDSDPEDSETPWVCTLKVRRTAAAIAKKAGTASNTLAKDSRGRSDRHEDIISSEGKPKSHEWNTHHDVLRIKVGTLSPTPHHPKVVAMLKMPFPLPDVQAERLGILKRRGLGESLILPCFWFLCAKSGYVPV